MKQELVELRLEVPTRERDALVLVVEHAHCLVELRRPGGLHYTVLVGEEC
ncbi:hypothetical protein [Salinigranum sp. GCM10025319]